MDLFSPLRWLEANWLQLVVTLLLIAGFAILDRFTAPRIEAGADHSGLKERDAARAIRTARLFVAIVGVLILSIVWGIEFGSILVFAGTTLTLLGVALFASWSILSNVTAYFILLLHPAYRRGVFVRVIEADNYVEGFIAEITLFNTRLITEKREVVIYPNNQLISRPTMLNPRERFTGVGKFPQPEPKKNTDAA